MLGVVFWIDSEGRELMWGFDPETEMQLALHRLKIAGNGRIQIENKETSNV